MSVFRPYCTFIGCFWANMGRFCDFFQKTVSVSKHYWALRYFSLLIV